MKIIASNDNVIVVDSSYTYTKGGIVVSFAFPIGVTEVAEIIELGEMFETYIKKSFGKILSKNFFSKTTTPVLFSKGEEMFMIWSFVAKDNEKALKDMKNMRIKEIKYE